MSPVIDGTNKLVFDGSQLEAVITLAELTASDGGGPVAALLFTLTGAPGAGELLLDGVALEAGDSFTQADIAEGRLVYRPGASSASEDGFTIKVSDRSGAETVATVGVAMPAFDHLQLAAQYGGFWGGSGRDFLASGSAADQMVGGGGHDRMHGHGGNDRLYGEDGNDLITGDEGDDLVDGGTGADLIFAGAGNDLVMGGAGDDDRLWGDAGDDRFIFRRGDGKDLIEDFRLHERDVVDLRDFASVLGDKTSLAALRAAGLVESPQHGGDTVLKLTATDWLTIRNINVSQLTDADFLFGRPINTAPQAGDDQLSTDEATPAFLEAVLLANDADPDPGDILKIGAVDGRGTLGRVTLQVGGSVVYDPAGRFEHLGVGETATDSFTYTVVDSRGAASTATVTLTVNGVNDAPLARHDMIIVGEKGPAAIGNLLSNDEDLDGDVLSLVGVNGAAADVGRTLTLLSGARLLVSSDGSYSYDPGTAFGGLRKGETASDSFTYTVADGHGGIHTAQMVITIEGADNQHLLIPGGEFLINSFKAGEQSAPGYFGGDAIAALADGGFVVTWMSVGQSGSGSGIYAQRYDADGLPRGGEFRVSRAPGHAQLSDVSALDDGGFLFTWSSLNQDGSGFGIHGRRYDSGGDSLGEEFRINSRTLADQYQSTATALTDGGFAVAWTSYGQDGSGYGIYGQRFAEDGQVLGAEFRINTRTTSDQLYPELTGLDDGGFLVTWTSYNQDGSGYGVYGQRFAADGQVLGAEFRINTHTISDQFMSDVAALEDGGFVVTWSSAGQDSSGLGVYGQRFDATGTTVGSEFALHTMTAGDQLRSDVTTLDDGGLLFAWQGAGLAGQGVHAQRFDADGNKLGMQFTLQSGLASPGFMPHLATLADGNVVAVWTEYGTMPLADRDYGVVGRLFEFVEVA